MKNLLVLLTCLGLSAGAHACLVDVGDFSYYKSVSMNWKRADNGQMYLVQEACGPGHKASLAAARLEDDRYTAAGVQHGSDEMQMKAFPDHVARSFLPEYGLNTVYIWNFGQDQLVVKVWDDEQHGDEMSIVPVETHRQARR